VEKAGGIMSADIIKLETPPVPTDYDRDSRDAVYDCMLCDIAEAFGPQKALEYVEQLFNDYFITEEKHQWIVNNLTDPNAPCYWETALRYKYADRG
jgi:hypothetical protein